MAKFSKVEVIQVLKEVGLLPIFYNKDIEICKNAFKACCEGGCRIFEFTNRGDFAHEIFQQLSHLRSESYPEMILGAGSIVDAPTTALYIQLGADFIVSPVLKEDMAIVCNRRKIAWTPGCGTLTEISRAEELGADMVKIFPAGQMGGPGFVKAIKGPCPWVSIIPTSGVSPDEENLRAWFDAGVHCVGMGSQLFSKELMPEENHDMLVKKIEETLAIIKKVRS